MSEQISASATLTSRTQGDEWLDALFAQDRKGRRQMAEQAVSITETKKRGEACWMGDHDARIARYESERRAFQDAIEDLRKNGIPEMSEAGQAAAIAVASRLARTLGISYGMY